PRFQVREHTRGLAEAEVAAPPDEVWRQLLDNLRQTESPCAAGLLPDPRLECVERLWRDAPLAPIIRDTKPQELALLRSRHRALRLVDLQPELYGQEPAHRGHDPFTGALAANIDVAVVRVAAKAVAPAGQLLVEIVKHDVAQEGRERTALRGPLIHRKDQAVFHHPGLEKCPDEFEHAFVGYPRSDAGHQTIVVNSVEKSFEVEINDDVVALGNVALRLGHRLMGRTPRSEAVTMLRKRRVPPLLQNLQHGLLDQSVDDARHAEFSDPAVRLGYFDPLDRLRLVGSVEQLRPYAWPVLTQVALGVLDGHPINASAALVPSNASPRTSEILSVTHLLHEVFRHSRAFECWLRHRWFGPR